MLCGRLFFGGDVRDRQLGHEPPLPTCVGDSGSSVT